MIYDFEGKKPCIHENTFVAESADVIGDVHLEEGCNVWFGAVLRADGEKIEVGKNTNIQDNAVLHITNNKFSVKVGNNVTIGHSAVVHSCKIGNNTLIGMGAIILDGAEIGDYTIIGAGSLVPPGKVIPSGVLAVGSPAKVVRELTLEERESLEVSAKNYVELSQKYKK